MLIANCNNSSVEKSNVSGKVFIKFSSREVDVSNYNPKDVGLPNNCETK